MRVVVTGAGGMIGSNLVRGLNALGIDDVIGVDDLLDGSKYRNLLGARISDYFDRSDFFERFRRREVGKVAAVFHQGACSDTMEHDGRYMLDNNYRCSKNLLDACQDQRVPLIYASSAATYGDSARFVEQPRYERPLNVYGYSKLLFDDVARRMLGAAQAQVVGLRYFNVYGPREQHKGRMASVAFHQFNQYQTSAKVHLFGEYGGYGPGQQSRDFVFVDDVVAVNLWFMEHPECRGVFNVGTGRAQPFNDVAEATVNACRARDGKPALTLAQQLEHGCIQYVAFPEALVGKYQCHTQADLTALRSAGCEHEFCDVATGVRRYAEWLYETIPTKKPVAAADALNS
jgi:ADP-L-glycero-D-manno-heptose 6-epimerase